MPSIRSRVIDAKLRAMLRKAEPGETHSLREIADGTGISFQAVHQIEQRALRKLRNLGAGEELLSEMILELRDEK